MYCRIRKIECPSAGEITLERSKGSNLEETELKYTICYRIGGRLGCTK